MRSVAYHVRVVPAACFGADDDGVGRGHQAGGRLCPADGRAAAAGGTRVGALWSRAKLALHHSPFTVHS